MKGLRGGTTLRRRPVFRGGGPVRGGGPKIYVSNAANIYLKKKEPPRELPARRFNILPFLGSIDPDLLA